MTYTIDYPPYYLENLEDVDPVTYYGRFRRRPYTINT